VWKNVRIGVLLLLLALVAAQQWLDRVATQSWHDPLWVGIFPVSADDSAKTRAYVAGLTPKDFADIEAFFAREARRYGLAVSQPVHVELYPAGSALPPQLPEDAGLLGRIWWSLKLRLFAARHTSFPGRAPATVRLFVLFHDPADLERVPDSHGLQKGLVGLVHAFADPALAGSNDLVIAHELLHTVGASDKYDPATGNPLVPAGLGDPAQHPRYPQEETEIMAGRRALSQHDSEMPRSLTHVVVGPATALEIRWSRP
jgi:hypothetical protein